MYVNSTVNIQASKRNTKNFPYLVLVVIAILFVSTVFGKEKPDSLITKGAFATNNYRNLFKENGHTEKAINDKVNRAFNQLFHGDSATQAIYFKAGQNINGPLSYILDVLSDDIRSEGMSYGMMIALQLDKKAEFNAIWNYAISKMYNSKPGHPAEGYFSWSLKRTGIPNSEGPAPDGEEYFVTALYMASGRWGNGQGIYNYKYWADRILTSIRHRPLLTGPTSFGIQTIGSMVNEDRKMILFVPQSNGPGFTDPSYHLPAFYEYWAKCGPIQDRTFWAAAADTSRNFFQKAAHPSTGLTSDYSDFDGKPLTTTFNNNSKHFAHDSWRSAMNWSVDWAWWQKDSRAKVLSNRIQDFFVAQGIKSYGSVYTPDGKLIDRNHSAGLVSANAAVSLASTHPKAKEFVEELWNLPIPQTVGERYYGGLLYMMSLLHCSGNFKIYLP